MYLFLIKYITDIMQQFHEQIPTHLFKKSGVTVQACYTHCSRYGAGSPKITQEAHPRVYEPTLAIFIKCPRTSALDLSVFALSISFCTQKLTYK